MTELYSPGELTEMLKKRKGIITLGVVLPVFSFAFSVFSCFVVDLNSLLLYKILTCSFLVISVWISIYLLFSGRIRLNDKIEHLSMMLNGKREIVCCEISEIHSPKTVSENILAYEIFDKQKDVAYYLEVGLVTLPFGVGDSITIAIVNNYVVAYEVKK